MTCVLTWPEVEIAAVGLLLGVLWLWRASRENGVPDDVDLGGN